MELVQDHLLIRERSLTFQMNKSVLSCPSDFDQLFFIEAPADCDSVAWFRVKDEMGSRFLSDLFCRKGDAASITDKRG